MTKVRAGPVLVPRLRRSDHLWIDPQPFRAGLTFGGPPGLASMTILQRHFRSQLAIGKPIARDDEVKVGL